MTCRTPARFSYANYARCRWLRPISHEESRTKREPGDLEIVADATGRNHRKVTHG